MSDFATKLKEAERILLAAIRQFDPRCVFGLFSGGHDSLTCSDFCLRACKPTALVHINTGIGVQKARCFVRESFQDRALLLEYKAEENTFANGLPDPKIYRDLILKYGFPGPPQHSTMYSQLKQRQIQKLVREHKKRHSDKIILVAGCRTQESQRRMGKAVEIMKVGAQIWVNPFLHFSKLDVTKYIEWRKLRRSPVVDLIHKSGECLCGAFAKPGELKELALWFPEEAAFIRRLEEEAAEAGHNWKWEERPPKPPKPMREEPLFQPLCMGCGAESVTA